MGRNVEIKARLRDPDETHRRFRRIFEQPAVVLEQEDTFFHSLRGRLKLRVMGPSEGELIHYEREDAPGPKMSRYVLSPTREPESLKAVLSGAFGVAGVVRKKRTLYLVGPVRIHFDEVEGLGSYLEIEVVLSESETLLDGRGVAEELMKRLGIAEADLVEGAYIDLLTGSDRP